MDDAAHHERFTYERGGFPEHLGLVNRVDPGQVLELGDGPTNRRDVKAVFQGNGRDVVRHRRLVCADLWVVEERR